MKALGLIETIGLVTAFEAADAALKAANVKLLGYENTKGGGRITVKFVGDVGAVKAGVAAGVAAALRIGRIESSLVIPRPHQEIEGLIAQIDRGPAQTADPVASPLLAPNPAPALAEARKLKPAAKPKAKPAADKAGKPKPVAKPKSTAGKAKQPASPPPPPPPAEVVDVIEPTAEAAGNLVEDAPPPTEAAVE
jgi:microcompartment protein CcmL/EutN